MVLVDGVPPAKAPCGVGGTAKISDTQVRSTGALTAEQRQSLPLSPPVSPAAAVAAPVALLASTTVAQIGGGAAALPATAAGNKLCRRSPRVPTKPQRDGYVDITQPGLSFAMPKGGIKKGETYADQIPKTSEVCSRDAPTKARVCASAQPGGSPKPGTKPFGKQRSVVSSMLPGPASTQGVTSDVSAPARPWRVAAGPTAESPHGLGADSRAHASACEAFTGCAQIELTSQTDGMARCETTDRHYTTARAAQVAPVPCGTASNVLPSRKRPSATIENDAVHHRGDDTNKDERTEETRTVHETIEHDAEDDEEDIPVSQLRLRHLLLRSPKKMKRIDPKCVTGVQLEETAGPDAPDSDDELPIFNLRTKTKMQSEDSPIPSLSASSIAAVLPAAASQESIPDQPKMLATISLAAAPSPHTAVLEQADRNRISDGRNDGTAVSSQTDADKQPDGCSPFAALSAIGDDDSDDSVQGTNPIQSSVSPSLRPVRASRSPVNYNEAELLAVRRPVYLDWAGEAGQDPSESGTKYAVRKAHSPTVRARVKSATLAAAVPSTSTDTAASATQCARKCAGIYGKRCSEHGRVEYLVRWIGFDQMHQRGPSWEFADRLGATANIEQFERRLQTAQALANAGMDTSATCAPGGGINEAVKATAATVSGKSYRRSSLGSPTDSDDDLPMRRLRQKLHSSSTGTASAATATTAPATVGTQRAVGVEDLDARVGNMEVKLLQDATTEHLGTLSDAAFSTAVSRSGKHVGGISDGGRREPRDLSGDGDTDSHGAIKAEQPPDKSFQLRETSKCAQSPQPPHLETAGNERRKPGQRVQIAASDGCAGIPAATVQSMRDLPNKLDDVVRPEPFVHIQSREPASASAACDSIEREAQMATAIMQQVIASQQADKAERLHRNSCAVGPAIAANGIHVVGPPSSGRRVMPGAVRRMVNRMIKPRSAFFSQPKDMHYRDCNGPQRPLPTAAAWPSVVSGAPAGAGRESPVRTYNSARGFIAANSNGSSSDGTVTQSGRDSSGKGNAGGELCEAAGSQIPSPHYRDICRLDTRECLIDHSLAASSHRCGTGGKKVVRWCPQIARVREYSESEREMEERRDWQRGIIARRDDMRSAVSLQLKSLATTG